MTSLGVKCRPWVRLRRCVTCLHDRLCYLLILLHVCILHASNNTPCRQRCDRANLDTGVQWIQAFEENRIEYHDLITMKILVMTNVTVISTCWAPLSDTKVTICVTFNCHKFPNVPILSPPKLQWLLLDGTPQGNKSWVLELYYLSIVFFVNKIAFYTRKGTKR